jgi:hypothetical protein
VVAFWDTNTVLTSGWSENHVRAAAYQAVQGSRAPAPGHLTPTYMRTLGPYLLRAVERLERGW